MNNVAPESPEELAAVLAKAAESKQTITLSGRRSKDRMAGPLSPSVFAVSTTGLTRLLSYEPKDLTVSVQAGMPYSELSRMLAESRQMVPLDPPFAQEATVGGVIAANSSGPRRRQYGTGRDQGDGMTF